MININKWREIIDEKSKEKDKRMNKTWDDKICTSSYHNFPTHICIPAGKTVTHKCPNCGNEISVMGGGAIYR